MSVPIWLTLTRIALRDALLDPAAQELDVGDEEVVADELDAAAEPVGERLPAVPVVLAEPVLDRDDRVALGRGRPRGRSCRAVSSVPPCALEAVRAVVMELARGEVERDRDPVAVTCALRRLEDRLASPRRRAEVRCEAALVADRRREAALAAGAPSGGGSISAPIRSASENVVGAGGDEHELLEVQRVPRVRAAVDDVHQRHGQDVRVRAADPAVERHPGLRRGAFAAASDAPRIALAPSRLFVGVPSSAISARRARAGRRRPSRRALRDLAVDVRDRPRHALAEPRVAAVAELDRLVLAGRRAEGTAAAPNAPDSSPTSTSTVGFPRESRIWRPWTWTIALTSTASLASRRSLVAVHASSSRSFAAYHRSCASPVSSTAGRGEPLGQLDALDEACGRGAERQLRVDVDEARDVDDREEEVAELVDHPRVRLRLRRRAGPRGRARPRARRAPRAPSRAARRGPASRSRPRPRAAATLRAWSSAGSDSGTSWKTPRGPPART